MGIVTGLDAARLARQIEAIDALNAKLKDLVLLKGAEVDILEDGSLALPDSILRRLDLVVVSVHSQFGLSEAKQTARVLRALERPCVSILAHPTGRLLGERAPYAINFERVLRAARERPCYLEINGQPARLDPDDVQVKAARDQGVLLSIASDAHSGAELAYVENGVRQARRGWVTKQKVINARPLSELRALLRKTMH
jgi:DNA polymerase (family 10)